MTWPPGVPTVTPRDLAEARDAMREGDEVGAGLLLCGGRTKLAWGRPPRAVERIVATTGLDRLIGHDPGDMTATVGAGMPLARLQDQLAGSGQRLAVDPPLGPARAATVGGVFATGDSGPGRLGYGSLRDLVIGMTLVLADGTIARSGGKVIKNVAGYDLCRLFCGSLGTLGLVAELTVRLHPLPAASRTVRVWADSDQARDLALALMASPIEPVAASHHRGQLLIRFEGPGARVGAESARARDLAGRLGRDADIIADPGAAAAAWRAVSDDEAGADGETVVRAATLPSDGAALVRSASAAGAELGVTVTVTSQVCLGLHTARIAGGDLAGHAALVERIRARATELGGHAVIRRQIPGLVERVDPFGDPPSGFAVMRRIKQRLDPHGRCGRGRFVGGL